MTLEAPTKTTGTEETTSIRATTFQLEFNGVVRPATGHPGPGQLPSVSRTQSAPLHALHLSWSASHRSPQQRAWREEQQARPWSAETGPGGTSTHPPTRIVSPARTLMRVRMDILLIVRKSVFFTRVLARARSSCWIPDSKELLAPPAPWSPHVLRSVPRSTQGDQGTRRPNPVQRRNQPSLSP